MPLMFGCVAPHGSVVPGTPGAELVPATTVAMQAMGQRLEAAAPDTIVIITPHGIRVDGALAISLAERGAGILEERATRDGEQMPIQVDLAVDQSFARALAECAASEGIPAVTVHYGATSGPHDCYPLDWGAVVPLWFLGRHFTRQPRIVAVVPSRALPLETFQRFGRVVADAAGSTQSRIALIASADLAHAHRADGPYGFDPAAREFDEWLAAAVKDGDLARLAQADMAWLERARPDGLWQILVLAGALERVPMRGEFLSYECPTYYGMLTAVYTPDER